MPAHAWSDNGALLRIACGEHESHRAVLLTPVTDAHLDLTPTPAIKGMVVKMQDADLHAIEGRRIEFHTGNELLCTAFTNEEGLRGVQREGRAQLRDGSSPSSVRRGRPGSTATGRICQSMAHGNLSLTAAGKPDD